MAGCASALLTLLVSGGHCQLLLAQQRDSTETVFRNATGFSFTFCIIICPISSFTTLTCTGSSLDHPHAGNPVGAHVHGGAALEQAAVGGCDTAVPFSVPLTTTTCCNFSFSGLKSAARRHVDNLKASSNDKQLSSQQRSDIAASFQRVSFKHISQRVDRAIRYSNQLLAQPVNCLVVCGGVASNLQLRSSLNAVGQRYALPVCFPPPAFCVDNGAMIAWLGIERIQSFGLSAVSAPDAVDTCFTRWPLGNQAVVSFK